MRYALGLQGAQFSHRGLPGDEEGLQNRTSYIFLDGITFPREWYRAIKYRIDSGDLEHDHRGEVESFPGRRGKGRDVIFHPLSFREFLKVMNPDIYSSLEVIKGLNPSEI
jgi:predicted AAA+ superfamily ATPase